MNKNKQVALYLSEEVVELVEVDGNGSVVSNSRVVLPVSVVENGVVVNNSVMVKAVEKSFNLAKPKKITKGEVEVVLPGENYILTTLVADRSKDVVNLIKKELPGSIESWYYNNQIFFHPENDVKSVVLMAVKKELIDQWQKVINDSQLQLSNFLADYVGLAACVDQTGLQAVINIGKQYSKFLVILDGKIVWGESLPFGEKKWWESIEEFKKLDEDEILEKYDDLIKSRPRKNSLSEKVVNKLESFIELTRAGFDDFENFFGQKIDTLTIFGQMSGVKSIDDVLSKKLNMSVNIGFCPAKKIKSQNYASTWGAAKLTLNSSIYNISMARSISEKNSSSKEDFIEEEKTVTQIKTRSVDAAVHNGHAKPKKSSTLSVSIVVIVLFLLAAASIWFYSNWEGNKPMVVQQNNINENTKVLTKVITSEIKFNITADSVDMTGQRLARTVKVQTNSKSTSTDEGLALASADLADDEALWPVMFGEDTWLIYRQPLLLSAAQDYLRTIQSTSTDSIVVNSLVPKSISAGKKEGDFIVNATAEIKMANDISLNLNDSQKTLTTTTSTTTDEVAKLKALASELIISNTPAGWANVRGGPGLQNKIVGKVNDGEKYDILDHENEWYKIKLASGDIAWVIRKYTDKK